MQKDIGKSAQVNIIIVSRSWLEGEESGSFHPDYLFALGRFAPLNRYYIIIQCRWSLFRQFFGNYLFITCMQKNNNSFILVYFCQRSQVKLFLQNLQKKHTRTVKKFFFFVPTQKCMKWLRCCTSAQITSFLMNYASNAKIVSI